jgi:hypothetical protein
MGRGIFFYIERLYRQPLLLAAGHCAARPAALLDQSLGGLEILRVQARRHEFAVRAALGAGRGRILQECLTKSMLLALVGSALAAVLAYVSTAVLSSFLTPTGSGEPTTLRPDARVVIVTTVLALLTLLFGLAPAMLAGRTSPNALLKTKGVQRRGGTTARRRRTRCRRRY